MKKVKTLGLLFLFLCAGLISNAQEYTPGESLSPEHKGFYAGGHASTNGFGVNFSYVLNKRFTFRTGFETMKLKYDFDFDENEISYAADLDYKTGGIFLFADYYYTKNLYISAGGLWNTFNPDVSGYAISDLEYGDISIPAEDVGTFDFQIEPEMKISPWVGAGVRSFMGKRDGIVFSFEVGMYYMGSPQLTIETTGLLSPTSDPAQGQADYLENQIDAYKMYPVVKLNLAFKIF